MNWIALTDYSQINKLVDQTETFLIFKHSTRCSISSMAFSRFEREFDFDQVPVLYLDLITYRSISNQLAESFNVHHQSPQVLLVKANVCLYNASHNAISTAAIKALL